MKIFPKHKFMEAELEKHNKLLDIIKGGAIVLVVLGHTYNSILHNFIYCFHVAIFFIISGICFNSKYTENLKGLLNLLIKRIKSLWIPYVVWNLLFMLLQNIFLKWGFLTDNPEIF